MGNSRPKKLYKYKPWKWVEEEKDGKKEKHNYTMDILTKNELYLNSVSSFNDPFEFIPPIINGTKEQMMEKYLKGKREAGENVKQKDIDKINYVIQSLTDDEKKQISIGMNESFRNTMGVYCFSEKKNNILMWSHYADYHKGICLEFDHSDPKLFSAERVSYSPDYPQYNLFSTEVEEKNAKYFTKSEDWTYEAEYRIVIPNFAEKAKGFEPQIITGVIIGCCMPNEQIEEVKEVLQTRKTPVTLYQARKKERDFGLDIIQIEQYGGSN